MELDLLAEFTPLPLCEDARTPEQLIAEDCHRWPPDRDGVRKVYLPPHLAGRAKRRFLRRLLQLEPEDAGLAESRRRDVPRAGGGCVCDQCGELFYDHPVDEVEPWVQVLCSRERVKL
jgi:hypothetical protein